MDVGNFCVFLSFNCQGSIFFHLHSEHKIILCFLFPFCDFFLHNTHNTVITVLYECWYFFIQFVLFFIFFISPLIMTKICSKQNKLSRSLKIGNLSSWTLKNLAVFCFFNEFYKLNS